MCGIMGGGRMAGRLDRFNFHTDPKKGRHETMHESQNSGLSSACQQDHSEGDSGDDKEPDGNRDGRRTSGFKKRERNKRPNYKFKNIDAESERTSTTSIHVFCGL